MRERKEKEELSDNACGDINLGLFVQRIIMRLMGLTQTQIDVSDPELSRQIKSK